MRGRLSSRGRSNAVATGSSTRSVVRSLRVRSPTSCHKYVTRSISDLWSGPAGDSSVFGHAAVGRSDHEGPERRWNHCEDASDQESRAACAGVRKERGHHPFAGMRGLVRQNRFSQDNETPHPVDAGCGRWSEGFDAENWGCGQCPHIWLRTGPYIGRIGPDSACFREFPVFARAGMRFESHLGHGVSAGQQGFWCFFVWTLSTLSPLI